LLASATFFLFNGRNEIPNITHIRSANHADLIAARANSIGTLTIQSTLTSNPGATSSCDINSSSATADEAVANGVAIDGAAVFAVADSGSTALAPGTVLTVIDNTAATPIAGTRGVAIPSPRHAPGTRRSARRWHENPERGTGRDLALLPDCDHPKTVA
jgi:hypothetical protein